MLAAANEIPHEGCKKCDWLLVYKFLKLVEIVVWNGEKSPVILLGNTHLAEPCRPSVHCDPRQHQRLNLNLPYNWTLHIMCIIQPNNYCLPFCLSTVMNWWQSRWSNNSMSNFCGKVFCNNLSVVKLCRNHHSKQNSGNFPKLSQRQINNNNNEAHE